MLTIPLQLQSHVNSMAHRWQRITMIVCHQYIFTDIHLWFQSTCQDIKTVVEWYQFTTWHTCNPQQHRPTCYWSNAVCRQAFVYVFITLSTWSLDNLPNTQRTTWQNGPAPIANQLTVFKPRYGWYWQTSRWHGGTIPDERHTSNNNYIFWLNHKFQTGLNNASTHWQQNNTTQPAYN